ACLSRGLDEKTSTCAVQPLLRTRCLVRVPHARILDPTTGWACKHRTILMVWLPAGTPSVRQKCRLSRTPQRFMKPHGDFTGECTAPPAASQGAWQGFLAASFALAPLVDPLHQVRRRHVVQRQQVLLRARRRKPSLFGDRRLRFLHLLEQSPGDFHIKG